MQRGTDLKFALQTLKHKYMKRVIFIAIFALIARESFAQIVLSEIMFDPLEDDDYYEFVEIYNLGDYPVDLDGYLLGDGTSSDSIIAVTGGTVIQSQQFGLILDPDYFIHPAVYDSLIPSNCLVLTVQSSTFGDRGLKNSEPETVTLTFSDSIIAYYTYHLGNSPGYSDEKMNLTAGDYPSNWVDGITLRGTPGAPNSVNFNPMDTNPVNLTILPEVFTPDGDGANDEAVIHYNIPAPYARITLRIFDIRGRVVRVLVKGELLSGSGELYWDGRWNNGEIGMIGPYIIHLEALSEFEGKKFTAKKVVYLGKKL
jgi:hypothetical protein